MGPSGASNRTDAEASLTSGRRPSGVDGYLYICLFMLEVAASRVVFYHMDTEANSAFVSSLGYIKFANRGTTMAKVLHAYRLFALWLEC